MKLEDIVRTRVLRALPYWVLDALNPRRPEIGDTPVASVAGVVFSRDRPMQLDALLRSYARMVRNPADLDVIYSTSSTAYASAYRDLVASHASPKVKFHDEDKLGGFSACLNRVVSRVSTRTVFFLVDDILFIRPVDLATFASLASRSVIPSLRLGRNILRSYTLNTRQRQPHLTRITSARVVAPSALGSKVEPLWAWRWRSGVIDWNYPYSLDGNIFLTGEMLECLSNVEFRNPNSLEVALHGQLGKSRQLWGICFDHSRLVNSPINRVQNEVVNLAGNVHQDALLKQWENGLRWDTSDLERISNSSVHQEVRLNTTAAEEWR